MKVIIKNIEYKTQELYSGDILIDTLHVATIYDFTAEDNEIRLEGKIEFKGMEYTRDYAENKIRELLHS